MFALAVTYYSSDKVLREQTINNEADIEIKLLWTTCMHCFPVNPLRLAEESESCEGITDPATCTNKTYYIKRSLLDVHCTLNGYCRKK